MLLAGEPGIGKSRLIAALAGAARERAAHPLALLLLAAPPGQRACTRSSRSSSGRPASSGRTRRRAKLDKLEALLAPRRRAEDVALLAELLSLPATTASALLDLSPQRKKEKTFEALLRQLEALARHKPVLMVFEDAHWIDPTSRELLDLLDRAGAAPAGAAARHLPARVPAAVDGPAARHDCWRSTGLTGARARRWSSGSPAATALPHEIVDGDCRAHGRRAAVRRGADQGGAGERRARAGDGYTVAAPLPPLAIPTTLHASLMARLDRLGPRKEVAQIGAAIGREFSYELLAAVADSRSAELHECAWISLASAGLVFRRGHAAAGHLPLQARAGAGRGLWHAAARPPPGAARAGSPRCSRNSSRTSSRPTRDAGAPLHRGRLGCTGRRLLAARPGSGACSLRRVEAVTQLDSGLNPPKLARITERHRREVALQVAARSSVDWDEGTCGAGDWPGLRPRLRAVPGTRRYAGVLPSAVWAARLSL